MATLELRLTPLLGRAGVAVETVYAIFKNKRGILAALVDYSVVGDDLPVPLLQRPNIQAARQETDQRRLIYTFAKDIAAIMQRMAPVFALLRTAVQTEPEIAGVLDHLLQERLKGMSYFVEGLPASHPYAMALRPVRPQRQSGWSPALKYFYC